MVQQQPFYQIVLNDSAKSGFTLKLIEPKDITGDCSSSIKFYSKSANGSKKDPKKMSAEDLRNIILTNGAGGGNNQTIGLRLI